MLGRFLEISLPAPDILASIAFYESLGFVQAVTGESWNHPYAVMTDGRLFLGLHQGPVVAAPALTFAQPELAWHAQKLVHAGVSFAEEHLGSETFNHATFNDPGGQRVTLVEARTFSPPVLEPAYESQCGYFSEFGMPCREWSPVADFWESAGFVALDPVMEPFPRKTLTSARLNLGLYRTRALRQPVLTFEAVDMKRRLDGLRRRGFELGDEMPDALDAATNAVLLAPEGTRLLLLTQGSTTLPDGLPLQ